MSTPAPRPLLATASIAVALADIFVSVPLPALAWLSVAGLHPVIWRYVEG